MMYRNRIVSLGWHSILGDCWPQQWKSDLFRGMRCESKISQATWVLTSLPGSCISVLLPHLAGCTEFLDVLSSQQGTSASGLCQALGSQLMFTASVKALQPSTDWDWTPTEEYPRNTIQLTTGLLRKSEKQKQIQWKKKKDSAFFVIANVHRFTMLFLWSTK